jgi:hypothetical protein
VQEICEQLCDHCLASDTDGDCLGTDNMTAMLVFLGNQVRCARARARVCSVCSAAVPARTGRHPVPSQKSELAHAMHNRTISRCVLLSAVRRAAQTAAPVGGSSSGSKAARWVIGEPGEWPPLCPPARRSLAAVFVSAASIPSVHPSMHAESQPRLRRLRRADLQMKEKADAEHAQMSEPPAAAAAAAASAAPSMGDDGEQVTPPTGRYQEVEGAAAPALAPSSSSRPQAQAQAQSQAIQAPRGRAGEEEGGAAPEGSPHEKKQRGQ